jgi:hypothetical protein
VRVLRCLSGGSCAKQVLASDGAVYAVKHPRNPQTATALAAEWIATSLMAKAGAPVPKPRLIKMEAGDEAALAIPYPVDPGRSIIHDFLAPEFACLIGNWNALAGAFVLDRWLANADERQLVVFKKKFLLPGATENVEADTFSPSLRILLIDQGCCFNGLEWNLKVGPRHCSRTYLSHLTPTGLCDLVQPWIARIQSLDNKALSEPFDTVPIEWLPSANRASCLMNALDRRRSRLWDLVQESAAALFQDSDKRNGMLQTSASEEVAA